MPVIDWNKVDWSDCALHVIAAVIATILLSLSPFAGAGLVVLIFWVREASQRTLYVNQVVDHWYPFAWGWGSQMELYCPSVAAIAVAAILQVI